VLASSIGPAQAISLYVVPDVPTDLGGTTYLPWNIVRYDDPPYSLATALPPGTAIDALHRTNAGDWLFSVEAPTDIGGVTYQPRDVIRRTGGGVFSSFFCGSVVGIPVGSDIDAVLLVGGDLILSFDVPTTIGAGTFDPADLLRFVPTGATCGSWAFGAVTFDASAAAPAVPITTNVPAADERGARTILGFDVPTTLAGTFLPGELVAWNGFAFALFEPLAGWPVSSFTNAVSFLVEPGTVPVTLIATRVAIDGSIIRLDWDAGCSVGDEDYGIYEGALGTWYSHTQVDCSDDLGDLVEDVGTTSGDRYYLVVSNNPNDEGSYGTSSSSVQRPVGTTTCQAAQAFVCP
jgi:hypothetical protein